MSSATVRTIVADSQVSETSGTTTEVRSAGATALSFDRFRRAYDMPNQQWHAELINRLTKFCQMLPGWDSYGAPPVGWDAGMFALAVLDSVMRPRTPVPQVVPSSVGGVQLEWHEKGIDLELHVTAPYVCEVWGEDSWSGKTLSEVLSTDFSALAPSIDALTSR